MAKKFTKKPIPRAIIFPGMGLKKNISTAIIIVRRFAPRPKRLERKCFPHRCQSFPFLEKTNAFERAKLVRVPKIKAIMVIRE
jgi:hypothetical protein